MKIAHIHIYGLTESVKASKYPMTVDTEKCVGNITEMTKKLGSAKCGSGHDNFLNGIIVQFDLTCSNKMWVEAERYHFLDFVSSQSTMHRITQFDPAVQCNEYVDKRMILVLKELIEDYKANPTPESYLRVLYNTPSGFQLTARLSTNYRQLKTIYYQRRNHRLPEWREFCAQLLELPHFSELCLGSGETE